MSDTAKVIFYIVAFLVIAFLVYLIAIKFAKGKSLGSGKINPDGANILFVGDSLTEYSNSYADQLKRQYPNINIKKIASVGKQTSWMLPQLQDELDSGAKYDAIAIWGGVNDIYGTNSIGGAESNLSLMYSLAKGSGAKVIALTVVPSASYSLSTPQTTQLTNNLNKWINSNSNVDAIIDVNTLVNDGNDGTRSDYLASDKLHLTSAAHAVIEEDFAQKVIR